MLDTLGIQIAAAASFLCVALALGFRIELSDWTALYACFSTGEIVKALPGPPQGLGTMEISYGYFFTNWATPSQVLSAALAIQIVNPLCALPGAALAIGVCEHGRSAEAASASSSAAAQSWPASAIAGDRGATSMPTPLTQVV